MAPRRGASQPEVEPALKVSREQLHQEIEARLAAGAELKQRSIDSALDLDQLGRDVRTWDDVNEELLRSRFTTSRVADEYVGVGIGFGGSRTPQQVYSDHIRRVERQTRKLESVRERLPYFDLPAGEAASRRTSPPIEPGTEIFVVHGHDHGTKYEVAEFLEKATGVRPIVLHEQDDLGLTVIEKLERSASRVRFAVVVLTGDDEGREVGTTELQKRARQNVILELGYFLALVRRPNVVILYEDGVELPTDLNGLLYKRLTGNWHTELYKALRAASIDADLSRI